MVQKLFFSYYTPFLPLSLDYTIPPMVYILYKLNNFFMHKEHKAIVDHISRLEGQLAAVKKELLLPEPDCVRASDTLLSASRSFAGLRQKFTEAFLLRHFVSPTTSKEKEMFTKLIALIKG
jgi:DNA-binding FrmR family transcriptional regulator